MTALPTFAQLSTLLVEQEHVVGPEHIDRNEHLNVDHYLLFSTAAMRGHAARELGIDRTYIDTRGLTTFTAEQHARYLAESALGDELAVSVVVADRGDKSIHIAALLLNRTRERLAFVMEAIRVHVDFSTRRAASIPDDLGDRLDALVERDRRDWALPLGGGLGVRR